MKKELWKVEGMAHVSGACCGPASHAETPSERSMQSPEVWHEGTRGICPLTRSFHQLKLRSLMPAGMLESPISLIGLFVQWSGSRFDSASSFIKLVV